MDQGEISVGPSHPTHPQVRGRVREHHPQVGPQAEGVDSGGEGAAGGLSHQLIISRGLELLPVQQVHRQEKHGGSHQVKQIAQAPQNHLTELLYTLYARRKFAHI